VEVAAPAARPRRAWRRPPGWAVASLVVALVVAGPLAALPLSFLVDPGAFGDVADSLHAGITAAEQAIDSGAAMAAFDRLRDAAATAERKTT